MANLKRLSKEEIEIKTLKLRVAYLEDELEKTPQKDVEEMMDLYKQEVKIKPELPNEATRLLRARLIFEEASETIKGLGCDILETVDGDDPTGLEVFINPDIEPNLVEIADGLTDLQVVTLGCASACGIDLYSIHQEVHRSNMSKAWKKEDGSFEIRKREDGKVLKSTDYSPADVKTILNKQGAKLK